MSNKQATVYKTQMGGKEVIIETGKFCDLSHGSCVVRCGETMVMVNVTMSEENQRRNRFFSIRS